MLFNHIQLVPSEAVLPQAVQAVIEEYGWSRAAILTQDDSVFIAVSGSGESSM